MDFQNFANAGAGVNLSHEHCGPECEHGNKANEENEEEFDSDDEEMPDLEEDDKEKK